MSFQPHSKHATFLDVSSSEWFHYFSLKRNRQIFGFDSSAVGPIFVLLWSAGFCSKGIVMYVICSIFVSLSGTSLDIPTCLGRPPGAAAMLHLSGTRTSLVGQGRFIGDLNFCNGDYQFHSSQLRSRASALGKRSSCGPFGDSGCFED